ncbi:MAG TPA: hypothetical protein VN181_05415 [Thermoanaerobaculia bacterium]|nr:hypothetical protein [Thermoanaerobaculia bacterium]
MERVERQPNDRRAAERARPGDRRAEAPNGGHTPGKAEGEERDVDEALNFDAYRSHQR